MVKALPETILLKADPNRFQFEAAGTITPGDLLDINSSSRMLRHATAGLAHSRMVAVENDIGGDEITDDYLVNEIVQFNACRPGDLVFMRLDTGQTIAVGDFLESSGDGSLRLFVVDSEAITPEEHIVGQAFQAVTTTSVQSRIKVLMG